MSRLFAVSLLSMGLFCMAQAQNIDITLTGTTDEQIAAVASRLVADTTLLVGLLQGASGFVVTALLISLAQLYIRALERLAAADQRVRQLLTDLCARLAALTTPAVGGR